MEHASSGPPPLPPPSPIGPQPSGRWWQPAVVNVRWCIIVNLLGCPGLGTIMARRRGGYLQLASMLAGTCFLVTFMAQYVQEMMRLWQSGDPERGLSLQGHYWLLGWGVGLCAAAWVGAAFSSYGLWKTQKTRL